jgi:hypothetical protein
MTDDDCRKSRAEAQLEREIRQSRKPGVKDLMAHIAGPGALKGASPVSPVQQAETEIGTWLRQTLPDGSGALRVVLHRHLKGSALLLDNLDRPIVALADYFRKLLATDALLTELVGEADVEWARAMDERPYFERKGAAPHPDDPYTLENVRQSLRDALERLPEAPGASSPAAIAKP